MADVEKKAALTDPFVTTVQQKAVSSRAQTTTPGTTQKSGGEDDWYKAALAKAQAIAKNMSSPPKPGTILLGSSFVFAQVVPLSLILQKPLTPQQVIQGRPSTSLPRRKVRNIAFMSNILANDHPRGRKVAGHCVCDRDGRPRY